MIKVTTTTVEPGKEGAILWKYLATDEADQSRFTSMIHTYVGGFCGASIIQSLPKDLNFKPDLFDAIMKEAMKNASGKNHNVIYYHIPFATGRVNAQRLELHLKVEQHLSDNYDVRLLHTMHNRNTNRMCRMWILPLNAVADVTLPID